MPTQSLMAVVASFVAVVAGCASDKGEGETNVTAAFPIDYAVDYREVRDCRQSADHALMNIRILADPLAFGPYLSRAQPFPEGAVVLKEQYDIADDKCQGDILLWTVMRKLSDRSAPDKLDWSWQWVDADRGVQDQDDAGCVSCHTGCGEPPDGYDGTCALP